MTADAPDETAPDETAPKATWARVGQTLAPFVGTALVILAFRLS